MHRILYATSTAQFAKGLLLILKFHTMFPAVIPHQTTKQTLKGLFSMMMHESGRFKQQPDYPVIHTPQSFLLHTVHQTLHRSFMLVERPFLNKFLVKIVID